MDDAQSLRVIFPAGVPKEIADDAPPDWRRTLHASPVPATDLRVLVGQPIPYVVRPILVRGSLTQIQGTQKGGKSAFLNYLSMCASMGLWPNGPHLTAPEPLNVLYITWEDPRIMMAQKLSLYAKGCDLEATCFPTNLTYIFRPFFSIEDPGHLEACKRMVSELGTDILIIDTLAHVHGCDENKADEMRLPMANLAALAEDSNIAVAYAHHIAKLSRDRSPQDKSRGSGAISAAWHMLVDWGVREEGSNVNPVQVQSKFLHKFLKWEIEYIHDGTETQEPTYVRWDVRTCESEVQGPPKLQLAWKAVETLSESRQNGISRYDLAQAMEVSPNTAKEYLLMLLAQGKLMKSWVGGGRGKRALFKRTPMNGPPPVAGISGE